MSSPLSHAAPSSDLAAHRLLALRAELDRIDDALQDGLIRRSETVREIGALGAKGATPLRPGREASIIRRLLARNRPPLRPQTVVRIWRELLAGSTAQQGPVRLAVGAPGLAPLAHEHFGALTAVDVHPGAEPALDEVRRGRATAAVLPMPSEAERWWTSLARPGEERLFVVARLPFWSRLPAEHALVVSAAAPDPSGDDRSLLSLPLRRDAGDLPSRLSALGVRTLARTQDATLVEADGFMEISDMRLEGLPAPVLLGAYAVPVGAEA